MNIPNFKSKYYIEFIEKSVENNVRIDVGKLLKINFDPNHQVKIENWTVVMIKPLLLTPWEKLCIVFFRRFNKKTREYNKQELNALPTNTVGLVVVIS